MCLRIKFIFIYSHNVITNWFGVEWNGTIAEVRQSLICFDCVSCVGELLLLLLRGYCSTVLCISKC